MWPCANCLSSLRFCVLILQCCGKNLINHHQHTSRCSLNAQWVLLGFPGVSDGKESSCNAGGARDMGLILGSGRYPGEGSGSPLQHFLENSMDKGAWLGYCPGGRKESDMTERLTLTLSRLIEQDELNNILKMTGIWRNLIRNNSLPTLHLSHFQFRLYVALWWIFLLQGCSQRSPRTIFNKIKELIKVKRKCIHFIFQAPKGWSYFLFVWSRLNWPNAVEQRKFLILVLKLFLVLQNGLETINREQPLPNHELESSYTFIMKAPWITSWAHIFNLWPTQVRVQTLSFIFLVTVGNLLHQSEP